MTDIATIPTWADDSIGHRWIAFHAAHPEVGEALLRLAREWRRARPDSECSLKMLWERLRWETAIGDPDANYRLNNIYTSLYARWLMETYPDLAGLFTLRARQTDGPPDKPDPPLNGHHSPADTPSQPLELPTLWRVLGPNGRSRHLIRRSLEHDPEAEALCGLSGMPRRDESLPRCATCQRQIAELIGSSPAEAG